MVLAEEHVQLLRERQVRKERRNETTTIQTFKTKEKKENNKNISNLQDVRVGEQDVPYVFLAHGGGAELLAQVLEHGHLVDVGGIEEALEGLVLGAQPVEKVLGKHSPAVGEDHLLNRQLALPEQPVQRRVRNRKEQRNVPQQLRQHCPHARHVPLVPRPRKHQVDYHDASLVRRHVLARRVQIVVVIQIRQRRKEPTRHPFLKKIK
jgi:hypothetical protein